MILSRRKSTAATLLIAAFVAISLCSPVLSASPDYWPTNGWCSSTPEAQGIDSTRLVDLFEKLKRIPLALDSILIVRNGYLVTDAYFYPFEKELKHPIYSCTKSITSILMGIAIDKGHIKNIRQPILDFFHDKTFTYLDERKRAITIAHLLTMSTGLDTRDSWKYGWSGLMKMIASDDWVQYVLDRKMAAFPGRSFDYSNCASFLLSAIIQRATKMKTIDFAQKHLFKPLGISDLKWTSSPKGIIIGYGELWLKPHDMAKIGWLYLNKGQWDGRQIVSQRWVEASTRKQMPGNLFDGYGYQWWIDKAGYYMAVGHLGQFIFVLPKKNMVVVCTGDMTGPNFYNSPKLLEEFIIPAAKETAPLPENKKMNAQLKTLIAGFGPEAAKGDTWMSPEDGIAKDGLFVRTASPGFQFTYPRGSRRANLNQPAQIMIMKMLNEGHIAASIKDIPKKISLSEVGPQKCASILRRFGSDVRVVLNKPIRLKDGIQAYRTDIDWMFSRIFPITTVFVSAYKEGKWVLLGADSFKWKYDLDEVAAAVESLTFKRSQL